MMHHFQHSLTYIYESIYSQGFIFFYCWVGSWISVLLDQSMYHKKQQSHYGQFSREESQKSGWEENLKKKKKTQKTKKQEKTWNPFQHLNFQNACYKREGFLREKENYLKANIKTCEGMSKFVCISDLFPETIFPGEKHMAMFVNNMKIKPNF